MNDCDDWYQWMDTCLRWQLEDVNQRAMMRDDNDDDEVMNDDRTN